MTSDHKVVYASGSSAPYSCSTGTAIYTGTDTSFIYTGRTNATTYSYRVCAIDEVFFETSLRRTTGYVYAAGETL